MEFYPGFQRKHKSYAVNGKIMLCTGVIFFAVLIIILCFHNYSSFFFRNRRRRYIQRRAQHLLSISTATPTTVAPNPKGLDPCILKMIPTFIYSTKATCFPPLDCAVCLSEFENDEEVRILPNCNHTFHVDCIDMWFYSHSNCPLCRTVVKPTEILEQPVAENNEMNTCSVASSSSSSSSSSASALKLESCPMKTLELMEVEILVREDRLISVR